VPFRARRKFIAAEPKEQLHAEGRPVPVGVPLAVQHVQSYWLLSTQLVKVRNVFGVESEVHAQLGRNAHLGAHALQKVYLDRHVPESSRWLVCTAGGGGAAEPRAPTPPREEAAPPPSAPPPPPAAAAPAAAAGGLDFLRDSPFYAAQVSRALAARRAPPSAAALSACVVGFGGAVPALVGGPVGVPAIIVVQEWWGVTPQVLAQAAALAALGYRVLVPDLYKGAVGVDAEEAHHLMGALDFQNALDELCQAAQHLKEEEGSARVGILGFCMGGALALGGAAHSADIDCAVSCYGVNAELFETARLARKPVQAHFGSEDAMEGLSDPATARALEAALHAAGAPSATVHHYERCGHAFLNDSPAPFDSFAAREAALGFAPVQPEQVELAWARIVAFFGAHLVPR
jgi:carboxymethylenebutenolidase